MSTEKAGEGRKRARDSKKPRRDEVLFGETREAAPPAPRTRRKTIRRRSEECEAETLRAVEAAHRSYYDAFQRLDLPAMRKCWWRDDSVGCIHPGWDRISGWQAVMESYKGIFLSTRAIRFSLGDLNVRVVGRLAWVSCIENLICEDSQMGEYLGAVMTTNILERRRGEWRLVHHHASAFSVEGFDPPEGLLN